MERDSSKELGRAFGAGQTAFQEVRDWLGWKFYLILLAAIVIGSFVKRWTGSGMLAFCALAIVGMSAGFVTRRVWSAERKNRIGRMD